MKSLAIALSGALCLAACTETDVEVARIDPPLSADDAARLDRIVTLPLSERIAFVEAAWIAEGCVARDDDLARFGAAIFRRLDQALGVTAEEAGREDFIAAVSGVLGDGEDALEDAGRLVYAGGAMRLNAPGCPA